MQIDVAATQDGDVVLDHEQVCWRRTATQGDVVFWDRFGMASGAMGGAALPAPSGQVQLLVRDGHQMCCTPDAEPVPNT